MRTVGTILVALGAVASAVLGCGSASQSAWVKPGSTGQERGRDTLSCLNSSRAGGEFDQTRYRQCMPDLGYVEPSK